MLTSKNKRSFIWISNRMKYIKAHAHTRTFCIHNEWLNVLDIYMYNDTDTMIQTQVYKSIWMAQGIKTCYEIKAQDEKPFSTLNDVDIHGINRMEICHWINEHWTTTEFQFNIYPTPWNRILFFFSIFQSNSFCFSKTCVHLETIRLNSDFKMILIKYL